MDIPPSKSSRSGHETTKVDLLVLTSCHLVGSRPLSGDRSGGMAKEDSGEMG